MKQQIQNIKRKSGIVVNNWLSPDFIYREHKYLNVSINFLEPCARMAEWLTQLDVTQRPSGLAGSIPAPGAHNFSTLNCSNLKK